MLHNLAKLEFTYRRVEVEGDFAVGRLLLFDDEFERYRDGQRTLPDFESFPVFIFPLKTQDTPPFLIVAFSGIGIV